MAVGTVLAVLVVIGCRPTRPRYVRRRHSQAHQIFDNETPTWRKEIARSHPMGELEYLEDIERYNKDPQHEPFPLPPPKHRQ